jgi:hypothetical protein
LRRFYFDGSPSITEGPSITGGWAHVWLFQRLLTTTIAVYSQRVDTANLRDWHCHCSFSCKLLCCRRRSWLVDNRRLCS